MEIVFHVRFYISISIGFFQVLFKFYANFWGDSSFINGLNRELASQVSTERSLNSVYIISIKLSIYFFNCTLSILVNYFLPTPPS